MSFGTATTTSSSRTFPQLVPHFSLFFFFFAVASTVMSIRILVIYGVGVRQLPRRCWHDRRLKFTKANGQRSYDKRDRAKNREIRCDASMENQEPML